VPRARTTAVRTLLVAAAVTGLVACTDGGGERGSAVASGDPDACPGDVVDVVVSVGQWGNVVRSVGGDCANVTTIVASGAVDPHDYEPGTADLAAVSEAELVVVNGAGYDSWAENAVASQDPEPAVLSVADLLDVPDGADPHLWYEPEAVHAIAPALADELHALSVGRREDKWTAMRDLVDDEVLAAFAVVAAPDDVAARVHERYDGMVDRFSVYASYPAPLDLWDPLVAAFR
jgi:zinc/manganese transport system substrate-binding protein